MTIFIGGPWGGQNRSMPSNQPMWRVAVRRPMKMIAERAYMAFDDRDVIRQVQYNKLNICGVEIFAEDGMTPTEVMRELVEGYKSRSPERSGYDDRGRLR